MERGRIFGGFFYKPNHDHLYIAAGAFLAKLIMISRKKERYLNKIAMRALFLFIFSVDDRKLNGTGAVFGVFYKPIMITCKVVQGRFLAKLIMITRKKERCLNKKAMCAAGGFFLLKKEWCLQHKRCAAGGFFLLTIGPVQNWCGRGSRTKDIFL